MNRVLPLFFACGLILLLRISNLSVRLSDTNIYFYTAFEILQGNILYKDIFFTNFPLFPYISAFYLFISNKNILFYYFTSTIEIILITILIYTIVYKKTRALLVSTTASFLYLFSFMVLSTSEHQTGVFLASLFSVIAYYVYEEKKYIIAGAFLACMLLTKAYFIPIALSFFVHLFLQKKYKDCIYQSVGFFITIFLILFPFIILSRKELFSDIIAYSLTRSAGVAKIDILWFFVIKDFVFFLLLLFNLFNYKKNLLFSLMSTFTIIFFLFYSDPYYLYFNFLPPMLCLSFPYFITFVEEKMSLQKMVIPSIVAVFLLYTFSLYYSNYRDLGKFSNFGQLLKIIEKEKPTTLYGANDTTPILAYETKIPLLNGIIDTNSNIFRKRLLNSSSLSNDAIKQKSLLIAHGAYYPMYDVNEPIIDEIFDKKLLLSKCKIIHSHPVYTEGFINRINLFSCK